MVFTAVGRTDPGRVRQTNEDAYRLCIRPDLELGFFVIADGMGGCNAGEVASQLAVETVFGAVEPWISGLAGSGGGSRSPEEMPELLAGAVLAANRAVYDASKLDPQRAGMGTTLTAAILLGEALTIAHVGDSRAVIVRRGRWKQITSDHSVVAEMVRQGGLSESEAMVHPQRNVLTRALGTEPGVAVDLWQDRVEPGDALVLCTDGVTRYLTNREIGKLAVFGRSLDEAAEVILGLANKRGGSDNVTVIVVRLPADVPPQAQKTDGHDD